MNYLIKTGHISLVRNYSRHSNNSRQLVFNILKNRNFISRIRRSKDTDYAALMENKKTIIIFLFTRQNMSECVFGGSFVLVHKNLSKTATQK